MKMNTKFPLPGRSSFRRHLVVSLRCLWLFILLLAAYGCSPLAGPTGTPVPGTRVQLTPGSTGTQAPGTSGQLTPGSTGMPTSGQTAAPNVNEGFLLTQQNPVCDHSPTTVWQGGPRSTAASSCRSGTFALSPVSQQQLAEIDVAKVNGKDYSRELTSFEVSADLTQAIAISSGLHESHTDIWAGFNVQTPVPGSGCGGFIFEASPLGYWNLEHVDSCTHIVVIHTGTFSPPAPSFGHGDSPTVTMQVKVTVQNGTLTGWVAEKRLVSIPDPFVPSPSLTSVIGLVAQYRTNSSLSPTMVTNFRLTTGRCREVAQACVPIL
jgi:hypothetical protein